MAFRIHDHVERGELDNRVKGMVRGKIWLQGCAQPVVLELKGNAHPDLAGCLLTFTNPEPSVPLPRAEDLNLLQRGSIGDLTASRKARVPAVPMEEFLNWPKDQGRPPSRWANCLYLEWFSEANGRVVIESADYELKISEPEWRLTPAEETERAQQAAAGLGDFMRQLTEAIEAQQRGQKDPEADWDEHDFEKLLKESDARTTKHMELLDKYGDSDEAEEIIAKEMGWLRELTPEEAAEEARHIEEMNRACDDAFTVACLKRALDHLHKSQAGLEAVAPKKLLPAAMVVEARKELFEIREGILQLMDEYRGRK